MTMRLALLLLLGGCATSQVRLVDVGGYRISMHLDGQGAPTIVFISGGSANSSVWASITPEVRRRGEVRTVIYNRAGVGDSEPRPGEYRIDDDATELVRALDACDVHGPIVLVAYAYGGFVATLMAANDPRVAGVVLVDAYPPSFFDAAEIARLMARFEVAYDSLTRENPASARSLIPLLEAYPATAERVREVTFPQSLPTIDIVPDWTWVPTFDEQVALRVAHRSFVEASPAREAKFAKGSFHNVMRDRPEVVIDAIVRMVQRVRGH
jgi:pimeloyl-ACP methyl ester carboxylesterase